MGPDRFFEDKIVEQIFTLWLYKINVFLSFCRGSSVEPYYHYNATDPDGYYYLSGFDNILVAGGITIYNMARSIAYLSWKKILDK